MPPSQSGKPRLLQPPAATLDIIFAHNEASTQEQDHNNANGLMLTCHHCPTLYSTGTDLQSGVVSRNWLRAVHDPVPPSSVMSFLYSRTPLANLLVHTTNAQLMWNTVQTLG